MATKENKANTPMATQLPETDPSLPANYRPSKENKANTDVVAPAFKPRLKKQLATYVPFVTWYPGLIVYGEIVRVFENSTTYGAKKNVEIKLNDSVKFANGDGELIELEKGDHLNIGETGLLKTLMSLPPGTTIEMFCKGKEKTPRGDAWDFDIFYE